MITAFPLHFCGDILPFDFLQMLPLTNLTLHCFSLFLRLKAPIGQIVLHALRDRQWVDLLCGKNSSQCHATQVLKAGNTSWTRPEMNTAITWTEKDKERLTFNTDVHLYLGNLHTCNILILINFNFHSVLHQVYGIHQDQYSIFFQSLVTPHQLIALNVIIDTVSLPAFCHFYSPILLF